MAVASYLTHVAIMKPKLIMINTAIWVWLYWCNCFSQYAYAHFEM